MKLIITDQGDQTVGVFPVQYTVDSPFADDYRDTDDLAAFRSLIVAAYQETAFGKIGAVYDWEYKELQEMHEG